MSSQSLSAVVAGLPSGPQVVTPSVSVSNPSSAVVSQSSSTALQVSVAPGKTVASLSSQSLSHPTPSASASRGKQTEYTLKLPVSAATSPSWSGWGMSRGFWVSTTRRKATESLATPSVATSQARLWAVPPALVARFVEAPVVVAVTHDPPPSTEYSRRTEGAGSASRS